MSCKFCLVILSSNLSYFAFVSSIIDLILSISYCKNLHSLASFSFKWTVFEIKSQSFKLILSSLNFSRSSSSSWAYSSIISSICIHFFSLFYRYCSFRSIHSFKSAIYSSYPICNLCSFIFVSAEICSKSKILLLSCSFS